MAAFTFAALSLAAQHHAVSQDTSIESPSIYTLTIIEAKLSDPERHTDVSAEILWDVVNDPAKTIWKEALQCTVVDGFKTKLMFGRMVSVITSITETQRGETRNMVSREIGTGLSVLARQAGERVALELEYQASRLDGENNGELPPPDTSTQQFTSTVLLKLNKPTLMASSPNSILLIMVSEETNTTTDR